MTQTPLQEAIQTLNYHKAVSDTDILSKASNIGIDLAINVINSLLPREKEFAEKCFEAGRSYGVQASHHPDKQQFLNKLYPKQ